MNQSFIHEVKLTRYFNKDENFQSLETEYC
jgi:hypothetical protein